MLKYCINKIFGTERFSYLVRRRDNVGIYFWCQDSYNVNTRVDRILSSGDPVFLINLPTTIQPRERIITLEDVENTPSNMIFISSLDGTGAGGEEEEEEDNSEEDPELIPENPLETFSWLLSPFSQQLPPFAAMTTITTLPDVKKVINESTYNKICKTIPKPEEFFCVICQSSDSDEGKIVQLQTCKHSFHDSCIKEWLTCQNITCGQCRQPVVTDPAEYGYLGYGSGESFISAQLPPSVSPAPPIRATGLASILNMSRVF